METTGFNNTTGVVRQKCEEFKALVMEENDAITVFEGKMTALKAALEQGHSSVSDISATVLGIYAHVNAIQNSVIEYVDRQNNDISADRALGLMDILNESRLCMTDLKTSFAHAGSPFKGLVNEQAAEYNAAEGALLNNIYMGIPQDDRQDFMDGAKEYSNIFFTLRSNIGTLDTNEPRL